MCHYTHLTPFEREKILFFLAEGKSITEIAHLLKRSKSTISREFRRNVAPACQYCSLTAQALYKQRREACHPHKRLEYAHLHSYIPICILEYHWSPEEIVGRIQLEHGRRLVSVPTIYRAIHAGLLNPPGASAKFVLRKLQHHGKRRHKKGNDEHRGKFVISHPIEERPASAANRSVRGHWEADTVVGKQGKACLVTKEFSKHAPLKKELKRVTFYFPAPHHPWERGTNENTNGLLREFFPKGKDITDTPEDYIQRKYHELNLRPRKCLGYKTPYEVYFSKVLHLA